MVKKIRSHGGDLSISVGGYNGVELGMACKSPEALAAAYQIVIDKYELTHIDFDIEGDDLGAAEEENRRFEAIQILKKTAAGKGKQLHVTLTMPCTTIGLSGLGQDEIKRAIAIQPDLIDLYKIMYDLVGFLRICFNYLNIFVGHLTMVDRALIWPPMLSTLWSKFTAKSRPFELT